VFLLSLIAVRKFNLLDSSYQGQQSMDIDAIFGITKPVAADIPRKSAIYVWGYNQSGQTGRKEEDDQLRIPKQLPPQLFGCPAGLNTRWLDIACGREHTAAIASDGSLFTWGLDFFNSYLFYSSFMCSFQNFVYNVGAVFSMMVIQSN
jgi:alpha-tubulin suppressor-like RCC1 family protein